MLKECCKQKNIPLVLPVSEDTILRFVLWLACDRKVSHATIGVYLAGIKQLHTIHGVPMPEARPAVVKLILQGKRNSEAANPAAAVRQRKPVTAAILKELKSQIRDSELELLDKRLLWCVCTILFFGALRASEALCTDRKVFDPRFTLCTEDVTRTEKILHLRIKCPKEEKKGRDTAVAIPAAADADICAVTAWDKWRALQPPSDPAQPVFRWKSGEPLTVAQLNKQLQQLLGAHFSGISTHSFRIGAASAMGKLGFSDDEIKSAGRWASPAFERYIRFGKARRTRIVEKFAQEI